MVKVKAPGSCGELVQGTIEGKNFLITCPVDLYSVAEVVSCNSETRPSYGIKVQKAIEKTFEYLKIEKQDFSLSVKTNLPIGKGMASSSADISAVCQAIAISNGLFLTPDEIADIALTIEPTDAIFYPGIVMFDHVKGCVRTKLGIPPVMYIAVFDVGGEIDTLGFNQRSDLNCLNIAKEGHVHNALRLVVKGVRTKNTKMIGKGATISALANQSILFKPSLESIIKISANFNAVGVNTAHSGTVIGVLFDLSSLNYSSECIKAICKAHPEITYMKTVKLISGGLLQIEGDSNNWIECF